MVVYSVTVGDDLMEVKLNKRSGLIPFCTVKFEIKKE
jgi:hypothetical protein